MFFFNLKSSLISLLALSDTYVIGLRQNLAPIDISVWRLKDGTRPERVTFAYPPPPPIVALMVEKYIQKMHFFTVESVFSPIERRGELLFQNKKDNDRIPANRKQIYNPVKSFF